MTQSKGLEPIVLEVNGLPTSDQLAAMLLEAAETAEQMQRNYYEAWLRARRARINHALLRDQLISDAYIHGSVEGKNAEQRAAQLAAIVGSDANLRIREDVMYHAESEVKRIETLLEAARVYRAALHDQVDLRVAELGVVAATAPRASRPRRKKEASIELANAPTLTH